MRTIYRDCVVGIIISKDNKLLMGRKDPQGGGVYADCWHLPGGGIEEGETRAAALRREISEEVAIDISEAKISLLDDTLTGESEKTLKDSGERVHCSMRFFVYRIRLQNKAATVHMKAGDDLKVIQWFSLDDVLTQKLTPPSREFFSTKLALVTDSND